MERPRASPSLSVQLAETQWGADDTGRSKEALIALFTKVAGHDGSADGEANAVHGRLGEEVSKIAHRRFDVVRGTERVEVRGRQWNGGATSELSLALCICCAA